MSDVFFEIMQLQPNDNEFLSAVRDSNSKETAYKLGFMHGVSYAAQMADEYAYRNAKRHERLVDALSKMVELYESEVHDSWDGTPQVGAMLAKAEKARALLSQLRPSPSQDSTEKGRTPGAWKLVPIEPTEAMIDAASDAYMPFGDMDLAIRCAILAAPEKGGE